MLISLVCYLQEADLFLLLTEALIGQPGHSKAATQIVYLLSVYGADINSLSQVTPGLETIKLFSCSAQLRLKFILLINVKMPPIVGILTFIYRINYQLCQSRPKSSIDLGYFSIKDKE